MTTQAVPISCRTPQTRRGTGMRSVSGALTLWWCVAMMPAHARDITFLHVSDTQPDSDGVQSLIVQAIGEMNQLPGTAYPAALGGTVGQPRGVIISGDLTQSGIAAEWQVFVDDWGLIGTDGLIHYPMYECVGNHDGAVSTAAAGIVRRGVIERNKTRVGATNISSNGLHYSFDWDDVHFVALNEYGGLESDQRYPGNQAYGRKIQSYGNPSENSLQFLVQNLATEVGDSGRPVVLYQHYGIDDFVFNPWGNAAAWWTEAQAMRLWEAIEGYNIIALLGGHNGSETTVDWFGIVNQHMDDHSKFGVFRITDNAISMASRDPRPPTPKWVDSWTRPTQVNSSMPPELLQGPYLVDGVSAAEMTVCWRMSTNQSCTLKWGSSNFKFERGSVNVTPYDTINHLYKYTLTGLDTVPAGDSVQYTLKIGDKYAPGFFYTPAAAGTKVRFLVADSPDAPSARDRMFATMYDKIYQDPAYHSFIVDPGSLTSAPQGMSAWDQDLFSRAKSARHIRYMLSRSPLVSTTGDDAEARSLFPYNYDASGAYSFDHAPVHVAVLVAANGLDNGTAQRTWLVNDLTANASPCKMVVWRRSGNSTQDQAFEALLRPLCQTHGVDLVVSNGSQFVHEVQNGTIYLTTSKNDSAIGTLLAVQVDNGIITYTKLAAAASAPSISSISAQRVEADGTTGPIGIIVDDGETDPANLTLSAVSSAPALIPAANLVFGGSGRNRTLTVSPAPGMVGTATITVTVTDGDAMHTEASFVVTVVAAQLHVLEWRSVGDHNGTAIGWNLLEGVSPVESRNRGLRRLEVRFSKPITLANGVNAVAIHGETTAGSVTPTDLGIQINTIANGDTLAITFSNAGGARALPDAAKWKFVLSSAAILGDGSSVLSSATEATRFVNTLVGDIDGNGKVNGLDLLHIKVGAFDPANPLSVRSDVNGDGAVDATDRDAAWANRSSRMDRLPTPE